MGSPQARRLRLGRLMLHFHEAGRLGLGTLRETLELYLRPLNYSVIGQPQSICLLESEPSLTFGSSMDGLKLLRVEQVPDQGIKALLNNNVVGTPRRSMVYQHGRAEDKYMSIPSPFFVSLVRKSKVIATCCFCKREVWSQGEKHAAYYVRYFTFHSSLRKLGDKYIDRPNDDGVLRREIRELLTGRHFGGSGPNYFYAYVDSGNTRSEKFVAGFGFQQVGSFASLIFSRFNPQIARRAERLTREERTAFKTRLLAFYSDHALVTDENLFTGGNYYVIKEEGQIVAGLQGHAEQWRVSHMPGRSGWLMMNVFPRVGLLRKIFNPDYRFAAIEGIYYLPGYEHHLTALLEHVMAVNKVYSAVICLDPASKVHAVVRSLRLGLVGKLRGEKHVSVMAKANDADLSDLTGPLYISVADVT